MRFRIKAPVLLKNAKLYSYEPGIWQNHYLQSSDLNARWTNFNADDRQPCELKCWSFRDVSKNHRFSAL